MLKKIISTGEPKVDKATTDAAIFKGIDLEGRISKRLENLDSYILQKN